MEYLTNLVSSGNPRKEKKLNARILCSYMKLSVAKLLNNHETTVTKSIKKRPTVMIQHSNSKNNSRKFLLCYCDAYMNESRPDLLRNLIIISHKHGAEQTKS